MNLLGSAHQIPIEVEADFTLVRKVLSTTPARTVLEDRITSVQLGKKSARSPRLQPLGTELAKLRFRWSVDEKGLRSFETRHSGPLTRKLKLGGALKRVYTLACRSPAHPVAVQSRWKDEQQIETRFASIPVQMHLGVAYRFLGHKKCGAHSCAHIRGRETAVIPDVQETKTRHRFKIGGLVKGRISVLVDSTRKGWFAWNVNRIFALAASKKTKTGKELTWGVRYEVLYRLFPPGAGAALSGDTAEKKPKTRARRVPRPPQKPDARPHDND